jgi:hypothetical protein
MTNQRDIAFILELVADVFEQAEAVGHQGHVVPDLRRMVATLKAAPPSNGFVWCEQFDDGPCSYHPLGGPDCAL